MGKEEEKSRHEGARKGRGTKGGKSAGQARRYVGEGEYIVGVPARDLSAAEAERFAPAIAEVEAATGRVLYVAVDGVDPVAMSKAGIQEG